MKITVIGVGYVGLVSAVGMAEMGNEVICLDIHQERVRKLQKGIPLIYESGLEDLLKRNILEKRISFTLHKKKAIQSSDLIFIAVGTPEGKDGRADMSAVWSAGADIGRYMNSPKFIITKSTVPVGTADKLKKVVRTAQGKRKVTFRMISNPEFLREGAAVKDFLNPDRVIVGVDHPSSAKVMTDLYRTTTRTDRPLFITDIRSAELIKYASNCFLATKVSFINEIANYCELVGADVTEVAKGMGLDPRIGSRYLHAGIGYGGSCFPKDVSALVTAGQDLGYHFRIVSAVRETNYAQREAFIQKIHETVSSLNGKTLAMWGLSFKPRTGDLREAPSITIIEHLLKDGAHLRVFDPVAMPDARKYFGRRKGVVFCKEPYSCLSNAVALLIVTEWDEFRLPDFQRIKRMLKKPVILDARNIYDPAKLSKLGFTYRGVGRV